MNAVARHLALPTAPVAWASAAALGTGLIYTSSPASVWFAALMLAIAAWAAGGLPAREGRWVVAALTAAVLARAATIATLSLLTITGDGPIRVLFPDASYIIRRSLWLRHFFVGEAVAPRDLFEAFQPYGDSTYYYALAFLQVLLGPAPYGLHLLSVAMYVGGAACFFRLVRTAWGPIAAFAGLVPILFMPTLFLWSVSPLKEAALFLVLTVALIAIVAIVRGPTWLWRGAGLAALLLSAALVGGLRQGGVALLGGGIALGLLLWAAARRPSLAIVVVLVAVPAAAAAWSRPAIRERAWAQIELAADRHIGHAVSIGRSYALLDADYYSSGTAMLATMGSHDAARFLTAAVVRFFTVPEPWTIASRFELALVPQQTVWLVLVALMIWGILAGLAREPLLACLLGGLVLTGVAIIAPNSGNIGTLIRHRDMIAPFVFWLSATGAVSAIFHLSRPRALGTRVNAVDASVLFIMALIAISYGLYVFLRTPAPELVEIEPRSWPAGAATRVTLHGRHLRPYLRAFYATSGAPFEVREGHTPSPSAPYLLRAPDAAELEMPPLAPGTYDLVLYERGQEVASLARAFTAEGSPSDVVAATMRATGSIALDATDTASDLAEGATVAVRGSADSVQIAYVGARRPDVIALQLAAGELPVAVHDRFTLPAVATLPCAIRDGRCEIGRTVVAPGTTLHIVSGGRERAFHVHALSAAPQSNAFVTVTARIRFVAPAETIALSRIGDRDSAADSADPEWAARLVQLRPARSDSAFTTADATIEIPAARGKDGPVYRGKILRSGDEFAFETPRYVLRGSIVQVSTAR